MRVYFPVAICLAIVASVAFPSESEAGWRRRQCQSCAAPANYSQSAPSPYAHAVVPIGAVSNDDLYETVWQCNNGRCSPVRRLKAKLVVPKPSVTAKPVATGNKASTATPAKPAEITKPKPVEPAPTPAVIVAKEPDEEDLPKVHFGPAVHFDDSNIPDVPQLVKSVIVSDAPKP